MASLWPQAQLHHHVELGDDWPHVFGKATDCFCEPEIEDLGCDAHGYHHRVLLHQNMTGHTRRL